MSIVLDIFVWLLVESFFAFIFYSTGWLILKILTLGQFKSEFKDFSSFKASQSKKANSVWLVGVSFYILLISALIYLNI